MVNGRWQWNKYVERWYLEQLRRAVPDFPAGSVHGDESPDFIVQSAPAAETQDVRPHAIEKGWVPMLADAAVTPNVQQAVPFFMVTDIEASVRFYVDRLGFAVTREWRPDRATGRLQWCWLQLGAAAVMLQEFSRDGQPGGAPQGSLGKGVSVYFICTDATAIYRDLVARGVSAGRPFVGNGMWVTSIEDPDGYHLYFESPTDVPEDTVYRE